LSAHERKSLGEEDDLASFSDGLLGELLASREIGSRVIDRRHLHQACDAAARRKGHFRQESWL
jgi:hypothetical protein